MEFVLAMLPSLEKEYGFWVSNRATPYIQKGVEMFKYFQYKVNMKTPRPESYREDMELVSHLRYHKGASIKDQGPRVCGSIRVSASVSHRRRLRFKLQSPVS